MPRGSHISRRATQSAACLKTPFTVQRGVLEQEYRRPALVLQRVSRGAPCGLHMRKQGRVNCRNIPRTLPASDGRRVRVAAYNTDLAVRAFLSLR